MKLDARIPALAAGLVISLAAAAWPAAAQEEASDLAALVARARAENPRIAAAGQMMAAARARATAAGASPNPVIAVGIQNALVSDPLSTRDFMTMRVVQLGQTLPYPGKLPLERRIAEAEAAVAEAEWRRVELEVVAAVERAYAELAFLARALAVVQDNRELLEDLVDVTETRYGIGTGSQQDVLKSQVELTRLGAELITLAERRAAVLAELNAVLDRPSATRVETPTLPERIHRAALPDPGTTVRFTAAALEFDQAAGPIPDLATLQRLAEEHSPRLAAHVVRIEAQRATAELAGKAALPDLDLSVGYGQRGGREDMMMVMVSAPIPIFKGRKGAPLAAAERARTASLEAEHRAMVAELHAEVAELRAALVRTRDRLALLAEGILPQARTSLQSAASGYSVASVDFLTVLDNQATLFGHELDLHRLLADFARDLAELESVVGTAVLR